MVTWLALTHHVADVVEQEALAMDLQAQACHPTCKAACAQSRSCCVRRSKQVEFLAPGAMHVIWDTDGTDPKPSLHRSCTIQSDTPQVITPSSGDDLEVVSPKARAVLTASVHNLTLTLTLTLLSFNARPCNPTIRLVSEPSSTHGPLFPLSTINVRLCNPVTHFFV